MFILILVCGVIYALIAMVLPLCLLIDIIHVPARKNLKSFTLLVFDFLLMIAFTLFPSTIAYLIVGGGNPVFEAMKVLVCYLVMWFPTVHFHKTIDFLVTGIDYDAILGKTSPF